MALDDTRKPVSTLNGPRAAAFFSTFALTVGLVVVGALLGNAVAFSFPFSDRLYGARGLHHARSVRRRPYRWFASNAVIRAKRAARRA